MSGKRAKPKGGQAAAAAPPANTDQVGPDAPLRSRHAASQSSVDVLDRPTTVPVAAPVLPGGSRGGSRNAARAERRRRERRRRLIAAGCAAVLLLVLVGAYLVHRAGSSPEGATTPPGRTQRVVLLEVGNRSASSGAALLVADPAVDEGALVLLPSQLMLDVAGYGSMTLGQVAALPDAAAGANTLGDALGVTVDGTWRLTPGGLAALVDAAGGVDVDVDVDVTGPGTAPGTTVVLIPAGRQHLDGASAVVYAGFRAAGEPEQTRMARLDAVLSAAIKALPTGADQVTLRLGALGAGSSSTMPDQLPAFLAALRTAEADTSVVHRTLPVTTIDAGGATPAVGIDNAAVASMVKDLFGSSTAPVRPGGAVRVLVQNGVGTPGLGSKARALLVADGFTYVPGGNAGSFGHRTSLVLVPDSAEAGRAEGAAVAAALGLPDTAVTLTSQGQSVADVVVILGRDFKPGK